MKPRNLVTPASPNLTRGDDSKHRAACEGKLDLIDDVYARGYQGRWARKHLVDLCGVCPLQRSCWADPEWRAALKATA